MRSSNDAKDATGTADADGACAERVFAIEVISDVLCQCRIKGSLLHSCAKYFWITMEFAKYTLYSSFNVTLYSNQIDSICLSHNADFAIGFDSHLDYREVTMEFSADEFSKW